ncbi:MAG: hypothetical protein ACC669_04140 [bacterium]
MPIDTEAFSRIVTHDDLDGIVSAALVSSVTGIGSFFFTGPVSIQRRETETTEGDVVCDLPCPVRFGMWFDHHAGNLEDIRLRGMDIDSIPGRFDLAPSCSRVIFDHFADKHEFPPFMADTVAGTDRVDSFDYKTMEEWREPLPERLLADSLFAAFGDPAASRKYMKHMVLLLRDGSMNDALSDETVKSFVDEYRNLESRSISLVEKDSWFHPDDSEKEVIIVDLTVHNRKPDIIRNTAFILHPNALAVLLVQNLFSRGKKTTNLSFSMSLSFLMNAREHSKDIGEIMRELNIGDGHPGAGAGQIQCAGKDEMLKVKEKTVEQIIKQWYEFG